ncbi:unnamed protein product [Rotaria sordida]|uniref:Uncharacterized protein n=1 Tax=Rotaria sordida TaxID=392033 RepID=A0A813ZWC1_9BILA|nr:unnamed protein product [Rotaria sordida]
MAYRTSKFDSGWPLPTTLSPIQNLNQIQSYDLSTATIELGSSSILNNDTHHHHQKLSIWVNDESYFEKLRSTAEYRQNNKVESYVTTSNMSNLLENFIGSIQPCTTWYSDDMKNMKSQVAIVLCRLELLKQSSLNNGMTKSIENDRYEYSVHQQFDTCILPIRTSHGTVFFDFSKQSINYDVYIQLMQLVRLSNLDKLIEKIFHKSGEYHHIDYKEQRQKQFEKEKNNHENLSDHHVYQLNQNLTINHYDSHSILSNSSNHNKYQLSNNNDLIKLHQTDKNSYYITMAKSVHFRSSSHCFVLDSIDISYRFQYDRNILRDTCHHFHSYDNMNLNNIQNENNDLLQTKFMLDDNPLLFRTGINEVTYEQLYSSMLELDVNSKRIIHFILVLCTYRMKKIYQLLESLLKSYVSQNISIVYVTFDEIKSFLIKYEQISHEILQKDILTSVTLQNSHNTSSSTMSTKKNIFKQHTILFQSVNFNKEFNTNADVNNENIINSISEQDILNLSPKTDNNTIEKFDLFNEEFLLNYLQKSSLVLIFMKHLDETYLNAFIRWYTEVLIKSDVHSNQSFTSSWNKAIEHCWLVTSDYQRAQTVFSIPKTNLFLWPTEHNDFDHISIIISSILILPIALTINYEIYTMFIDGMSIVDKHCQETTLDRNICIKMALLRIWSTICERKNNAIITCDDDLQYFGEYAKMLFTEYDDYIDEHKMKTKFVSIHGMPLAKTFLQKISNDQNPFSYDLITISDVIQNTNFANKQSPSLTTHSFQNEVNDASDNNLSDEKLSLNRHSSELLTILTEFYEQEKTLQADKIFHPHTLILLDQYTPLTIGSMTEIK